MRSADEILADALALPVGDRGMVAGQLIDSLDEDAVDELAEHSGADPVPPFGR